MHRQTQTGQPAPALPVRHQMRTALPALPVLQVLQELAHHQKQTVPRGRPQPVQQVQVRRQI